MGNTLTRHILHSSGMEVHGLLFRPDSSDIKGTWAVFSHGYTSHKGDLINWGYRLSERGIPTMIFDLPGHFLGSFAEVPSFEVFKSKSHLLFESAYNEMKNQVSSDCQEIILGGHSLGALLSFWALNLPSFQNLKRLGIGVGLGLGPEEGPHLFETKFFEKMLEIRGQLVSKQIPPSKVFSWIQEEKLSIQISGESVAIITGKNDAVVADNGSERLKKLLEESGNQVELIEPKNLPHHQPDLAASHLISYLKKLGL